MKQEFDCVKDKEKLLSEIRRVFREENVPAAAGTPDGPADQGFEYDVCKKFYASRSWPDISYEELLNTYPSGVSAAVTFLSDQGFTYYLPLFMSCILDRFDESAGLAESLLYDLMRPATPHEQKQFDNKIVALDAAQRKCVAHFLEYLAQCHAESYPRDVHIHGSPEESLSHYWSRFL
jgi:hypothetical protein